MEWIKEECVSEKKNNAGVTTIVVVCAMAIIMALSLGLFLTASVMMQTAGKTAAREQSKVLAVSFSKQLERELTSPQNHYDSQSMEETDKAADAGNTSLWHYIKQNISDGTWPYYEEGGMPIHGRERAMRSFAMEAEGVAGEIAETQLTLYWLKGEAENMPSQLVVKTAVTVKEQTYVITDVYTLKVSGEDYETWEWSLLERK